MARQRTASTSSQKAGTTQPLADFVDIADAYAEEVVDDRPGEKYGKWIRLAAKRYRADRRTANRKKRPPYLFSRQQANRYCEFIECLPHVEGEWDSPTIRLEPAQVFFVVQLFGFRNHDGTRRFTTALFAVARKNAKSTLAAAILIAVFCLEPGIGPQVLSAATTGDQARVVWGIAKRMVERAHDLQEAFMVEPFANAIARHDVGGTFKPINAKASTQDGLNPSALCFDELHAHKTRDLFDVLRSAAGARKSPLFLYTTTEGYENPGPWAEMRSFAFQVLEGVVKAEHFLAIYYAVDDADDDFDERAWRKANPLLGRSVTVEKLREHAVEAKQQPGGLAEFRIKRLNRRAAAADGLIDLRKWRRCGGEIPLAELVNVPCWGGLDLASTRDMTAWRLVWMLDETLYTWGRYWVPSDAVAQRTERGSVPYRSWVEQGFVTMTEGDVADYRQIHQEIASDCGRFRVQTIAFDPWNAVQLVQQLQEDGLEMVQFIQGPKSYHPAIQELERLYMGKRLAHGGNPVLNWNAANLVARRDVNMNMAPDRKRSSDKIDGIVALIMAVGISGITQHKSFWE